MSLFHRRWGRVLGWKLRRGFTLIELLVVMAIIAILMGLVIGVAGPIQHQARLYRARAEVKAFETALTRFETDNGFVPTCELIQTNGGVYSGDPNTDYEKSARALFLSLTGRSWFLSVDTATMGQNYMSDLKGGIVCYNTKLDKSSATNAQSANYDTYTAAGGLTQGDYFWDPWGNPYGFYYSTNSTNHSLFNQVTYDLWSTASETNTPADTASVFYKRWVANWPNQ